MVNKDKNQYESFLITMFDNITSKNTSYLKLPDSNCFTYCLKEIMHSLKNEIEGKVTHNYSNLLINNFYNYMLHDTIFKELNSWQYSRLVLTLKNCSEGDMTNKEEIRNYLDHVCSIWSKPYQRKILKKINKSLQTGTLEDADHNIVIIFINELLANGNNYLYLNYMLKLYKQGKFGSCENFLEYLMYGNLDSFDILIPITDLGLKDQKLFELKGQKIVKENNATYCKVYGNNISDFFHLIKENLLRIESLFNILRFYSNSKIDFLRDQDILVSSKYFNETFEIQFDDITKYIGATPPYKNLEETIDTLNELKETSQDLYHKILNTISYAEKDRDYMDSSSFVDNWIALETLVSMSGRKIGYDSVNYFIPIMLTARFVLNDANNTLEQAYRNYGKNIRLNEFLSLVAQNKFDFSKILNPYYKWELKRLATVFSDTKQIQKEFERIERLLRLDIMRIYMLRNEYVHASNLQAFNSMQHIKLKHLLPASLDEFFKILNLNKCDKSKIDAAFEVYTDFLNRYNIRNTAFKLLNEKIKVKNGSVTLSTTLEEHKITVDIFAMNILKNNMLPLKNYITSDEI